MFDNNFLKNRPVFWSRLGFSYDPPMKNDQGKPLVFTENFDKYLSTHVDFLNAGVVIHTSILHLGWMGVDEYDYSLTDRSLESIFSAGEDVYYIPRIKLNVPVDWCRENPEEVFVYYGGPQTKEEIAALVGTEAQDYLGYEAPNGYYRAGDYVDTRPNVNGMIARQSFSSKKWLKDAGEALTRFIDRLESSKYADRIIGYHIAYGTSGETLMWGRIDKRYGDYGISNRREFYRFGLKKYGSAEALGKAWCQPGATEDTLVLPTPEMKAGKTYDLDEFLRARDEDRILIDYDDFTSEANVSALEYFSKIVKEKTNKLVGAFYGYSLYIDNAAYSGHLALDRLLASPYVDFFASPKSYSHCAAGESGGEISPAQSINLSKLFVEELDNRTYLATECEADKKSGYVSEGLSDTLTVMRREFCKNLAHDSGFWWMDLGGGWFADEYIMNEVKSLVKLNTSLRAKPHKSTSDMLIVFDERSMLSVKENVDLHKGFLRYFIYDTYASGVLADVYRASDLPKLDLTQYKLIVFAYNFYMDKATREVIKSLPDDVTVAFSYAAGVWSEDGFSLDASEELTSYRITKDDSLDGKYDFPMIKAERIAGGREKNIVFDKPFLTSEEIRNIAKAAGCHIYSESEGVTIYGDNRFTGVFNKNAGGTVTLRERGTYRDVISGKVFSDTDTIPLPEKDKQALLLVKE